MKSEIADLVSTRLATPGPSAPASGNSTSAGRDVQHLPPDRRRRWFGKPSTLAQEILVLPVSHAGDGRRAGIGLDLRGIFAAVDRAGRPLSIGSSTGRRGPCFWREPAVRLWATLWIAGRKKQTVVDDGPYRACRNPLYVGSFVMGIGLGLFLKSLVFAAGLGLVMSLYLWFVVPAEERYMRSRFGAAFDDYCRRVPRWIPKHRPAATKRDFPAGRRPRGTLPRMRTNGLLDAAGGHGRTDVSPPRDGLADLVGRLAA